VLVVLIVGIIAVLAASKGGHGGGGGHGHVGGPRFAHAGIRSTTSVAVYAPWPSPPPASPANGPSHPDLELRLVDRETGRLLWRAAADLPANPRSAEDVSEAVGRLAATLPLAAPR